MNGALLATVPRIHRCFFSFWFSSNIASAAMLLASFQAGARFAFQDV